jgi:histidyl-tRNA synthetase
MEKIIQSVKGTREFYPEDMSIRTWLYQTIREISESYGYQEYEGPFLEKIDLYAAKSGEELVKEQAFVFPDRGGELITLRPELTPTLSRMVAQRQNELIYPLRWWSFGPFWRYERPQKGRTREFFQWNIDIFGTNSVEADAELVSVAAKFYEKVGFKPEEVQILVNDRRLMTSLLAEIGIPREKNQSVFRLIDRREKMVTKDWEVFALEIGLSQDQTSILKEKIADPELWKKSEEMQRFFTALESLGAKPYVHYDAKIIRGLDYYTGIVFEAYHTQEGGRSLLGGGRYDNLLADVGGNPLPGTGFAMGDVLITLLLKKYGLVPSLPLVPASVFVTVFDQTLMSNSLAMASQLRREGLNVICYPEAVKLPKQLKYADRLGMRFVVIIGPDEAEKGLATIKDLKERAQETIDQSRVAEAIERMRIGNL